ncbi:Spiroplasmavirus-related protein [Spiroplasma kunkelii CR2-3x]|uniref:Spiroplasmavirus-related protein n=1 Tax=Spiroplasma kunkelii CR2-3x TaxID=273035 RepID=A0A0K2JHG8_SPIKU|nr:lipoprotein [Spiroplasma kunkelii]ALA97862.1 Spiroplasmavirus-related protein [Spiroplasma kunkelii CR2-3x]
MKKWISILGTIVLTATSTTTLISCNKENNNENGASNKQKPSPENSNWKLITNYYWLKNNFDNKYYFVIWKQSYSNEWELKKFKHDSKYDMRIENYIEGNRFKGLYRWDGNGEPETPTINKNTGKITDWKKQKGT